MPWTRASETDRTLVCPGSLFLPREPESAKSEKALEAADWGTMVHLWKATGAISGRPNHEKLFLKRLKSTAIYPSTYWPEGGRHEITAAYNCRTGEVALPPEGADDSWKLQLPPEFLPGTTDYLGSIMGEPWVDDLKTGAWPPRGPNDSWQLKVYALCAWVLGGRDGGVYGSITHWPRYPAGGLPQRSEIVYYSHKQMVAIDTKIKLRYWLFNKILDQPQLLNEELVPGEEQCMFCPSKPYCPQWKV